MIKAVNGRYRIQLTTNFYLDEFTCKDGRGTIIHKPNDRFVVCVQMLQEARGRIKEGLKINSAYRTWAHHKAIYQRLKKPVTKKSKHLENHAFDVTYYDPKLRTKNRIIKLKEALIASGFQGIGINLVKMFVHCDAGLKRSWTY